MKLVEVEIFDFKSIKHEKVSINNGQVCFVGKNECGKSSIIQAVSYLNFLEREFDRSSINKKSDRYPNGFPIVSGIFTITDDKLKILKELFKAHTLLNADDPLLDNAKIIQVKRWGNGLSNISMTISDNKEYALEFSEYLNNKAEFYDEFCEKIYPAIEYYENEELLIEAATIEELLGGDKRFETFRRLLFLGGCNDLSELDNEDDNFISSFHAQIEDNVNLLLRKHYIQDESIKIALRTIRNNKLNLVIKDNSQLTFMIKERSPGFRYYFSFLINKLYSTQKNKNKNFIFLLDEPGNNLHPKGAKDLLKTFNEISSSNQILYTTHNPFLLTRNNVDALVYVSKFPKDGTKINMKPYLNKYQILRHELGILLNDSFLIGDINLIVEGNTEQLAFNRLFQIEKYNELEWLNVYNAGGVNNVSQALNYLGVKNLNLNGIVILDSDQEARDEKLKKGYSEAMKTQKWHAIEINDCFSEKTDRTFEDLFPQKIYIEAFNEYCNALKDREVFDKPYVNISSTKEISSPIVNEISKHFFSFINNERKKSNSISKQDVIRIVLDKIDKLKEEDRILALKNCYLLLDKIKELCKKIEKNVAN